MSGLAPDLTDDDLLTLRNVYLRDQYTPYTPANPPSVPVAIPEIALSVFNMTTKTNFNSDDALQSFAEQVWYENELNIQQTYDSALYRWTREHASDGTVDTDAVTYATNIQKNTWIKLTAARVLDTMLRDSRVLTSFPGGAAGIAAVLKDIRQQIRDLRWSGAIRTFETVRG